MDKKDTKMTLTDWIWIIIGACFFMYMLYLFIFELLIKETFLFFTQNDSEEIFSMAQFGLRQISSVVISALLFYFLTFYHNRLERFLEYRAKKRLEPLSSRRLCPSRYLFVADTKGILKSRAQAAELCSWISGIEVSLHHH